VNPPCQQVPPTAETAEGQSLTKITCSSRVASEMQQKPISAYQPSGGIDYICMRPQGLVVCRRTSLSRTLVYIYIYIEQCVSTECVCMPCPKSCRAAFPTPLLGFQSCLPAPPAHWAGPSIIYHSMSCWGLSVVKSRQGRSWRQLGPRGGPARRGWRGFAL
jgi:hypothetical protein